MKKIFLVFLLISCICPSETFAAVQQDSSQHSTEAGAWNTGVYQNLFRQLLFIPDAVIQRKIDSAFQQVFYGNDTTQRLYFPAGNDLAYIKDVVHQDVRTEGMSYGMMIAVQMNKKEEFDRLWKWTKTFMQHKSGPFKGYFAWQCKIDGTVIDPSPASDGEEWFVMDLFFASGRWGDGEGIYNYNAEAQQLLQTMLHKESDPEHFGRSTNMFNTKEHQVVFVPNVDASTFTDPSYHLPHYYELWAQWAKQDTQFWYDAAHTSRQFLKNAVNHKTGLAPDYAQFDGKPFSAPWNPETKNFEFDAWRVAANVAMDYSWFAKDEWEVEQSNRLLDFFYSEGIQEYGYIYTVEGKRLVSKHGAGLTGTNAVAALASTHPHRKEFVQELWSADIPEGLYRYYDGLLYMLSMLQVSGNFRMYTPAIH